MRGAGLVAAITVVLALPSAAAGQPALSVARGDVAFWSGPGGEPAGCGERCWEYSLDVRESADRLRVGIDHATVGDVWTMEVEGPDGAGSTFGPETGLYSNEAVYASPSPGRWAIRIRAVPEVADLRFRARAKLEMVPAPPAQAEPVLPNLQALPPYAFTFDYPVTNGSTDGAPQGQPTPGGLQSCHAEEIAEESAVRCLRMAFGVRNTGQGPMQLFYEEGTGYEDRPLWQRIVATDGTHTDREAGVAKYHETHMHYHHDNAIGLTLWKVTDPARGGLAPTAAEHLKGFAHRNELLREWRVFYPLWDDFGFGLRAGWGDYYEWDRPGNYIDFGLNGDGRYVVRIVADPVNGIAESNEADNTSYTLLDVAGTTITWLESGRGTDPWDRCRILMPQGAEPDLPASAQPARPADCPPDTTGLPAGTAPASPSNARPTAPTAGRKSKRKRARCARKKKGAGKRAARRRAKRCAARRRAAKRRAAKRRAARRRAA